MTETERGSGSRVFLSFVIGGLIGAAAAILFAPGSGRDTRKKIRDFADDVKNRVTEYAGDVRGKVADTVHKGVEAVQERKSMIRSAIDAGKEAYSREKERVEHDGGKEQAS
ncbi:MAG: YtxH domain-containing protein [Nitrospiraceae bacterium]|nr:YtxH domain-containing protein [Nitrospiraceae bacterium]